MGLEHMGTSEPADRRLALLAGVFRPGTKVVYGRHGERILEGVIFKVEGKYAYVNYKHLGKVLEDYVPLNKLKDLNPGIYLKKG